MTNEQRTLCLEHIKNTMLELDVRHAGESAKMLLRHNAERREKEGEMQRFSAGINDNAQPALFVVPVAPVAPSRQFVNEQHLYPKGRIHTLQGQGDRPWRFRDEAAGVQEYLYPKGGRITFSGTQIGTVDITDGFFVGRWLTVYEAQALHQGKK